MSCGVTPSAKTPTGISNAIQTIYNNRYNEGIEASSVGGFLGVQYSLLNSEDFSIQFNYSGTVIIAMELHWQYGISGNPIVSISPNVTILYKDTEHIGGSRSGGYECRIAMKVNMNTISNKTLNFSVSGVNSSVKQYSAFIFKSNV